MLKISEIWQNITILNTDPLYARSSNCLLCANIQTQEEKRCVSAPAPVLQWRVDLPCLPHLLCQPTLPHYYSAQARRPLHSGTGSADV